MPRTLMGDPAATPMCRTEEEARCMAAEMAKIRDEIVVKEKESLKMQSRIWTDATKKKPQILS